MQKQIIKVSGKSKLDDYRQEVESQFPAGSFILDKKLTGCGATTMFLRDDYYTILCSPRLELMHCKANDPEFIGLIHEFRKADDRTSSVFDLQNQMMDYIRQMELKYNNPFTKPEEYKAPKILVSYDSFKHVAERLEQEGILGKFRIVVDEFQTLMTDAAYRGNVEIEFLQNLSYSNQIIFLSATPYLEKYLDQITLFQQLPLVELEWPKEAYRTANIQKLPYYRQSITKTINRIISKYQVEHYFEVKMLAGREVFATEAVFFLNDVQRIIAIVKQNGLTPDNTNIICARTDENIKRIENIKDDDGLRIGFTVGHVPKEGEANKPYTFVTKCAFEGVDFYSTCAYTYIFSDITLKHLGLDISIDVPQIMGRQRDDSNPFRYDATFFYKTSEDYDALSEPEFQNRVLDKLAITDEWKSTFNTSSPKMQKSMAKKLRRSQEADNCEEDYVVIYDDKIAQKVGIETNYLAMYNEIRAWEIRNTTYISDCQVMSAIDEATMSIADDSDVKLFLSNFPNDFVGQMKLYCDAISARPVLRNVLDFLPQIPIEIKRYYNSLGPDIIKSNSYIEARLRRLLITNGNKETLKDATEDVFVPGCFYPYKQVKAILSDIYSMLGIEKTAKASDLANMEWMSCKPAQAWIDGHKENGFLIV